MEVQESISAAEHVRRKHYHVEAAIRDFELRAEKLMREIIDQQQFALSDPKRFAYASYVRHALLRHSNLLRSIEKLKQACHPRQSAA
jgi:phage regulator Rha-like protein